MRAIVHADITAAARVLLVTPSALRDHLCDRMLREAHWADIFVKRTGKLHVLWGNGTLRSAAYARWLAPEPTCGAQEYAQCLALVFEHVIARTWSTLE